MGYAHSALSKLRSVCFDGLFLPHSIALGALSFSSGWLKLCIHCNWHAGPSQCPEFAAAQHDVLAPVPLVCSSCIPLMFGSNSCSSYPVTPVLPQFYLTYFLFPFLPFLKHAVAYTHHTHLPFLPSADDKYI